MWAGRKRWIFVTVAVALMGVAAWWGYGVQRRRRPLVWWGTIEARTIEVGSRVGGRVAELLAREGDRVTAGQPLVRLEPGDLEAQRTAALGQLEEARARLERLTRAGRQGVDVAPERAHEIAAAQARLREAQVAVDKARRDAARARQLGSRGAAAEADVEDAEQQVRSAIAHRDAQLQALEQLRAGTHEDVQGAIGAVTAAQGKLDAVDVALDELTVRAPRAARVETLDLRPGDLLAPNAPAAMLLEDDQLYARIYVPETQLAWIHPGQALSLFVDSFPDRAFASEVEHISHVGEYLPRNLQSADERANQVFATRVVLRDGREVVRPGMAARVEVRPETVARPAPEVRR